MKMNLGSGKDFRQDYVNVDIDRLWQPDIILNLDLIEHIGGCLVEENRFGIRMMEANSFDEIRAYDLLEHVTHIVRVMTNCLTLLKVGGQMHVSVPYDLSYGAWQDPTHVRAFNERSWLYYTDWFWYLGWKTHRFVLRSLWYDYSNIGVEMNARGESMDTILRTPRAVDAMKAVLEKVALNEQDIEQLKLHTRT